MADPALHQCLSQQRESYQRYGKPIDLGKATFVQARVAAVQLRADPVDYTRLFFAFL